MNRNGRILVSSLKGGVGKSTAACGIASELAGAGLTVVLCDLDFRSRSLDLLLGVADFVVFTIEDYILGRCSYDSLLLPVNTSGHGKLFLCPAPPESIFEAQGQSLYDKIPAALESIAKAAEADYLICDTGADSRVPMIIANEFADFAIVVSEQSRTSIRAAEATAEQFSKCRKIKKVRLVINNFDVESARSGSRAGIISTIDECAVRCIGVIPHDDKLASLQDRGKLPGRSSNAASAMHNIANRILGIQTPLFFGMKKLKRRLTL